MENSMEQTTWKQMLKDSSWVSLAWDWFQNLLGRTVEGVLWVTMVYACYTLIPGIAAPPPGVNNAMFIIQFIGLDVGGLGLNKIAQQQGLPKWAYARVIAYILIAITLITVSFAGIERAIPTLDQRYVTAIEIILVVARSIMTVLYGQAIHSLKAVDHSTRNRIAELEIEVSNLHTQLDTKQKELSNVQQEANSLRGQLDTLQKTASDLRGQLQAKNGQLESVQSQLSSVQLDSQSMRGHLDSGQQELNNLRVQLQRKDVALATLQGQLDTRQQEVSSLQNQVSSLQQEASANLREAQLLQAKLDTQLDSRMDTGHSTGQQNGQLDTGQHKIITFAGHSTGQLDTDRIEQVRQLLKNNPDMSARAIANIIGCSPTTASKLKEQAS
jgi:predicted  nucleic acid-binding Zn-ribbon protein